MPLLTVSCEAEDLFHSAQKLRLNYEYISAGTKMAVILDMLTAARFILALFSCLASNGAVGGSTTSRLT